MTDNLSIRLISPSDSPVLQSLITAGAVSGQMSFTYDYLADTLLVSQSLATDLHGAIVERDGVAIAMAFGDFVPVQWSGASSLGVYVSNLRVHPAHQRQGVGRQLGDWGMNYLAEKAGEDAVIYAAIPLGNLSLALAHRYGFQATAAIQGGVIPMRRQPPAAHLDLNVTSATPADLSAIVEGMNDFYKEHNLWNPVTPESLQQFLDVQIAGLQPNQLFVVRRREQIVGGLSLSDRSGLVRMRLTGVSPLVRLLGRLTGLLSSDGVLRALTVRQVWYKWGELEACRFLWQQLRYQLRQQGNCLGIAYDPRDVLADVFQPPIWLPMLKARYLVRARQPIEMERPTYCIAGA